MAKNQKPILEDDPLDEVPTAEEEQTMLEQQLEELKQNCAQLKLYRKGADKKFAFLTSYDPSQWDLDGVKEEYGGGTYQVWAYNENKRLVGKYPFSIDSKIKGKLDRTFEIPQGQSFNPSDILTPIMNSNQASMDKFMLMMTENSKQSLAMMQGMMTSMGQIIAAAMLSNNRQEKNVTNSMDELIKLKMLFGDDNKQVMSMFMKGIEFASKNQEEPSLMKDIIQGVLPALPAMFSGGAVAPAGALPAPKNPEDQMKLAKQLKLREMYTRLQTACRTNEVPERLVDYLIQSAKSLGIEDEALEILDQPGWYEQLCKLDPEATKYKDYLYKCHALIMEEYPTEDETESIPGGKA